MATVSIGSTGRQYGTLKLFIDAVLAGTVTGASTGNAILGEIYPDSPFNDDIVSITADPGDSYSECVMQPAATFEHDMTEGSGVVFKLTGNATSGNYSCNRNPYHLKGVEFDAAGFAQVTGTGNIGLLQVGGISGRKPKLSRLIVHGVVSANNGIGMNLNGGYYAACMVYDIESTHTGVRRARGIRWVDNATQSGYCAFHSIDNIVATNGSGTAIGFEVANDAGRILNCCVSGNITGTSSGAKSAFLGGASTGGTNNAADDTTISWGSSNQASITLSSAYQATSVGVGYLKTKASGALEDTGKTVSDPTTTPSIDMSIDALGNDRASVTTEDIGCHELELDGGGGGVTVPIMVYSYKRRRTA